MEQIIAPADVARHLDVNVVEKSIYVLVRNVLDMSPMSIVSAAKRPMYAALNLPRKSLRTMIGVSTTMRKVNQQMNHVYPYTLEQLDVGPMYPPNGSAPSPHSACKAEIPESIKIHPSVKIPHDTSK